MQTTNLAKRLNNIKNIQQSNAPLNKELNKELKKEHDDFKITTKPNNEDELIKKTLLKKIEDTNDIDNSKSIKEENDIEDTHLNRHIIKNADKKQTKEILFEIATNVLNSLKHSNLTPSEENYTIYLNKVIDQQPLNIRTRLLNELNKHVDLKKDYNEELLSLEKDVKKSYNQFVEILKATQDLYANSQAFKKELLILSSSIYEIENSEKNSSFLKHLNKIDLLLNKYNKILDKVFGNIKINYSKSLENLETIKKKACFNTTFGFYNMPMWIKNILSYHKTMELIEQKEDNSIILLKPYIQDLTKEQTMYVYNVVNSLIKKNIRKYDMVSMLDNNVFVIYLKYSNIKDGENVIKRIESSIASSFISFDAQNTIEISIYQRIFEVDMTQPIENVLKYCLFEFKKELISQ